MVHPRTSAGVLPMRCATRPRLQWRLTTGLESVQRSALQLKRRHLTAVTRAYLTGRRFLLEALVGCPRLLADQDIYPVKDQFELGV